MDKALYVIQGESGGNPGAVGDGGVAQGLFQIQDGTRFAGRPDAATLQDPEQNIKYAAQQLGAAGGDWTAWGEGSSYNGQTFGALGNQPYNGASNSTGGIIKVSKPADTIPDTKPVAGPGLAGVARIVGNAASKLKTASTYASNAKFQTDNPASTFEPTGDFTTDAQNYFSISQDAYAQLHKMQQSSPYPLIIDETNGVVQRLTGEYDDSGNPISTIDANATKLLQRAQTASDALDRLYAGKKAGLFDTGNDAAQAYLTSEKEKAAEATRKYGDYTQRVKDLIALDDVPVQRAATLASTLNTINGANAARKSDYSTGMGLTGRPTPTDTAPFAAAIKATIPNSAPAPYDINQGAFQSQTPSATKIPIPKPQAVLSQYGLGDQPTADQLASSPGNGPNSLDLSLSGSAGGGGGGGGGGSSAAPISLPPNIQFNRPNITSSLTAGPQLSPLQKILLGMK